MCTRFFSKTINTKVSRKKTPRRTLSPKESLEHGDHWELFFLERYVSTGDRQYREWFCWSCQYWQLQQKHSRYCLSYLSSSTEPSWPHQLHHPRGPGERSTLHLLRYTLFVRSSVGTTLLSLNQRYPPSTSPDHRVLGSWTHGWCAYSFHPARRCRSSRLHVMYREVLLLFMNLRSHQFHHVNLRHRHYMYTELFCSRKRWQMK